MNEFRTCCCSLPDLCGPQVCDTCINNNCNTKVYTYTHNPKKIMKEVKEYDIFGNLIKHEITYYDAEPRCIIGIDPYNDKPSTKL